MKPYIIIDTETAPTANFDPRNMGGTSLVYDFGWIVTNGEQVFERRSFIVSETFNNADLMNSAYYARKLPQYRAGIGKDWTLAPFLEIYSQFIADIHTYNVRDVWAYNANFDRDALNNTVATYSNGFRPYFFPYNIRIKDVWSAAGDTICNTDKYVLWCLDHNYTKPSGNPLTTAEVVYRYLTSNIDFIEAHTALAACEIENYILQRVRKRKQKHNTTPNRSGWRKASKRCEKIQIKRLRARYSKK